MGSNCISRLIISAHGLSDYYLYQSPTTKFILILELDIYENAYLTPYQINTTHRRYDTALILPFQDTYLEEQTTDQKMQ